MIVNRQIPKLVYNKIQELNYKHKEHLYVICDMIIRVGSIRRNHNEYYDFIDIPKNNFRSILTDDTAYYNGLEVLINNNIIECDEIYSKDGGKAKGYRFNKDLISLLIKVELTKKTLSGKIIKNRNKRYIETPKDLIKSRDYFYNNFNLDYDKAIEWVNNWFNDELYYLNTNYNLYLCGGKIQNEYDKEFKTLTIKNCYYISQIENIRDRELYFNRNKTNNRLDTNLTNLKGELKKFITIPNLTQIDLSNSQPYILYLTILNYYYTYVAGISKTNTNNIIEINKEELEMYGEWVSSGQYYENFMNYKFPPHKYSININNLDRNLIKDIMFKVFYSHNDLYPELKDIFKSIFPTIYNWIYEYKKENYKSLSIKMQKIESEMCIDIISQELDKLNINYLTIHDAWLVDNNDIPKVKEIIESKFKEKYNNIPHLKTEKITN